MTAAPTVAKDRTIKDGGGSLATMSGSLRMSDKVVDGGGIIGGVAVVVAGGGRSWNVLAPSPLEEECGLFKLTVRDKGLLFCHY